MFKNAISYLLEGNIQIVINTSNCSCVCLLVKGVVHSVMLYAAGSLSAQFVVKDYLIHLHTLEKHLNFCFRCLGSTWYMTITEVSIVSQF